MSPRNDSGPPALLRAVFMLGLCVGMIISGFLLLFVDCERSNKDSHEEAYAQEQP